ncbi:MAG: hypothetical protein QOI82_2746 [Actinomycetota bacterium]|nr:hypothetical protein [Actinomycetota bacterium]
MLVFALVVLMVFGLILGAVFNGTVAGEHSTPFTRAHLNNTYAADAGIEAGLQQIRKSSTFCASSLNPSANLQLTGLANGHDVTVGCSVIGGTNSAIGASGYAAVVLGKTGTTISTSGGAATKEIGGPVFLSGGTNLTQPLLVHGGDVDNLCFHAGIGGAVRPSPTSDLRVDEGFQWSPCTEAQPVVEHVLPTEPCNGVLPATCSPDPNGYASLDGKCRLFLPGTYTTAPVVDTAWPNYFLSGLYHFKNVGSWTIKSASVIAGLATQPAANAPACTQTEPTQVTGGVNISTLPGGSMVSGNGATFVFSGNSWIDMQSGGSFEIFPRLRAASDPGTWTQRLSIVALPTDEGTWPKSTVTDQILKPKSGNTPTELIRGVYYTPAASLSVVATNTSVAMFLGGVVVSALDISASASAVSLQIGLPQQIAERVVRLTSTSTPTDGEQPVTSVAVVKVSTSAGFPVTVTAWRNSAPDYS